MIALPRLLTETQAAEYLGVPKASLKRLAVGRVPIDGRIRWDRHALDHWLDDMGGLSAPSTANANQTEAEAALDRFFSDQRHAARHS
jgi:hypothetical protein